MMFIYLFLIAALASFVGSLQPGPVNMAVIAAAAKGSYKNALMIAVGGSLPEMFFAGFALFASALILENQTVFNVVRYVFVAIFLAAGAFLLLTKAKPAEVVLRKNGFAFGIGLASINPQLILYWLGMITTLDTYGIHLSTETMLSKIGFAVGTSSGAFVLHVLLIYLMKRNKMQAIHELISDHAQHLLGALMLILGIVQLVQLV